MELEEVVQFIRPLRKIYKEYGERGKYLSAEELLNILVKEGYTSTREEAEKIIWGCNARRIIRFCRVGTKRYSLDQECFELITEEDLIESELEFLDEWYEDRVKNAEPRAYVLEEDEYIDPQNPHERKVREIYAEKNRKILTEEELIQELVKKGYTETEAKEMVRSANIEGVLQDYIERRGGDRVEYTYEIMSPDEWNLMYYRSRPPTDTRGRVLQTEGAADGVRYLDIKNIFRERLEKTGRASMGHGQLVEEIMKRCGVDRNLAEEAVSDALLERKILPVSWEKMPKEQEGYWWFGVSVMSPANLGDEPEFKDLREIFRGAEKEGKKVLTREELMERMVERFDLSPDEFPEGFMEDAESLFKIERVVEDGKTVYRWVEKVDEREGKFLKQNVSWVMKNIQRLLQSRLNLKLNRVPSEDPDELPDFEVEDSEGRLGFCSIVLKPVDDDPEATLVGVTLEQCVWVNLDVDEEEFFEADEPEDLLEFVEDRERVGEALKKLEDMGFKFGILYCDDVLECGAVTARFWNYYQTDELEKLVEHIKTIMEMQREFKA
ncbi:MAG: hypothetical protein QXR19_10110 [Candidatus Jordarchaeaceae archaeon]